MSHRTEPLSARAQKGKHRAAKKSVSKTVYFRENAKNSEKEKNESKEKAPEWLKYVPGGSTAGNSDNLLDSMSPKLIPPEYTGPTTRSRSRRRMSSDSDEF